MYLIPWHDELSAKSCIPGILKTFLVGDPVSVAVTFAIPVKASKLLQYLFFKNTFYANGFYFKYPILDYVLYGIDMLSP